MTHWWGCAPHMRLPSLRRAWKRYSVILASFCQCLRILYLLIQRRILYWRQWLHRGTFLVAASSRKPGVSKIIEETDCSPLLKRSQVPKVTSWGELSGSFGSNKISKSGYWWHEKDSVLPLTTPRTSFWCADRLALWCIQRGRSSWKAQILSSVLIN